MDIRKPAMVLGQPTQAEPPTVVIFGVTHGGTTMVAGIVQRCGVDLGPDLPHNLEDQAFAYRPLDEMVQTIRERNQGGVWGWKFPRAASYLSQIHGELRNPHYIVVWRDIKAIAARSVRKGEPVIESLQWAHGVQAQNIRTLQDLPGPALLISYEKAVLDPVGLAEQVQEFLGLEAPLDRDDIAHFARPGTYKA